MSQLDKIYAYITHANKLLVFKHVDFPEAGIQVPGGTVDAGETHKGAVLREVAEETGLDSLVLKKYLGRDEYQDKNTDPSEILVRYFFHLRCPREVPETWQHYEQHPSDGSPAPIVFEFYWLPFVEADGILDPYFTVMLNQLRESMAGDQQRDLNREELREVSDD